MSAETAERTSGGFRARLRAAALALLLLTVSSAVAAVLGETVARQFFVLRSFAWLADDGVTPWQVEDPERGYRLPPNWSGRLVASEFDTRISLDGRGLRGIYPSQPAAPRVLVAGDSFTFGVGAEHHESLPARLGQHLQAAGRPAEVWNLGVPGYSLPPSVLHVEQLLATEDLRHRPPAVVVLAIYAGSVPSGADDITGSVSFVDARAAAGSDPATAEASPPSTAPFEADRAPSRARFRPKRWLERNSSLYGLVMARLAPQIRMWKRQLAGQDQEHLQALRRRGFEVVDQWLARLVRSAGNATVVVVGIAEHPDILVGDREVFDRLEELVTSQSLIFVDGFALFESLGPDDFYYPLDGHLNPRGYDRLAAELAPAVSAALAASQDGIEESPE